MNGIIIISVVSAIMIVLSAIILAGKGDHLIAGYNTADEKTRQQYNIKRLRLVVAAMCLLTTLLCWIPLLAESTLAAICIPILCLIIIFGGILVVNSWCKKK